MIGDNNFVPKYTAEAPSDDEKMLKDLMQYILDQSISSNEIEESYHRLCGIIEDGTATTTVEALTIKMQQMSNAHFPLNRFVDLITDRRSMEQGEEEYKNFVHNLPVSQKEKTMLVSIVDKKRSGTLLLLVAGEHELFCEIKIDAPEEIPSNVLGYILNKKLIEIIERIPSGKSFEFSFEEA
jgi:transcriptional regulator CtsR